MKMRRITATLLVLAMLLVCLPMQTLAAEQGATLIPRTMDQVKTITDIEEGIVTFTDMDELETLCAQAQSDPSKEYVCIYIGGSGLSFKQDLVIPQNMAVVISYGASTTNIYIDHGVTIDLNGYLESTYFENRGTLRISPTGMLVTGMKTDTFSGLILNSGTIVTRGGLSTGIVGAECIYNNGAGSVLIYGSFYDENSFLNVCKRAAERNDGHWFYYFENSNPHFQFTQGTAVIPENCSVMFTSACYLENADLDVYGYIDCSTDLVIDGNIRIQPGGMLAVGAGMSVEGTLENYGEIAILSGVDGFNGALWVQNPQNYKDIKGANQGAIIVAAKAGDEYPAHALVGMNVNSFAVEWLQEDGKSYWILRGYQYTPPVEPEVPQEGTLILSGSWSDGSPNWEMYSNGVLKIFGTSMQGTTNPDLYPWKAADFPMVKRIELSGVSNVANEAFSNMPTVESIFLDNSITVIGEKAFAYCKNLKSITIPASVTKIEGFAFLDTNLQTVTFEENSQLTTLEAGVFRGTDIAEIQLPSGITAIPGALFYECSNLTSVVIPEGVERIYKGAFESCLSLTAIVVPEGVESIDSAAFGNCESLTYISLPESLTVVAKDAFKGCYAVTTIELYSPLQIREYFPNYELITKVVVHGEATSLDGFNDLKGLTSIEFPETVTVIKYGAFGGCKALTEFDWPKNLTTIGRGAFSGTGLTSVVLPETVSEVGNGAFNRNPNLISFTFSDPVTRIGSNTFGECTGLTTVDLGCVTEIGFQAFYNCSSLKDVVLPDTLERMDYMAFYGCTSLDEITIPKNVTVIEHSVFMNCSNLKEVRFAGDAPTIESHTFSNVTATVYYPDRNDTWTESVMQDYGGDLTWIPYCANHDYNTVTVEADCLNPGKFIHTCTICDEVETELAGEPPQGHDYGLGEDGNPDFWDTTCDVCGAERVVDKHRPTHSMYRMYNPNSGEHFYTGSMEERQNLEAAGWKYEGVGFTFPATTGKPVYRLYDRDNTMEHLYTMDEAEKDKLLAEGWILEGIAFNSGREDEVPQYRLHNPNATIGAYHFTASVEERDALIAAGWEDQGIGFYTCWQ